MGKEEGEGVGKGGTFKGGPHQLFSPAILNKFSDVEWARGVPAEKLKLIFLAYDILHNTFSLLTICREFAILKIWLCFFAPFEIFRAMQNYFGQTTLMKTFLPQRPHFAMKRMFLRLKCHLASILKKSGV